MIMHNLILGFLSAPIKIIIIDISVKERLFSEVSAGIPVLRKEDLEPVLCN